MTARFDRVNHVDRVGWLLVGLRDMSNSGTQGGDYVLTRTHLAVCLLRHLNLDISSSKEYWELYHVFLFHEGLRPSP
jgi:hypothetical protein